MERNINNIERNNIMNRTFENKKLMLEQENQFNSQIINNDDVKAQTLSLFGINKSNILDLNDNSINNNILIKQPQFELENIYRERLISLYKNKSKEELLNYFIESEINNILLRKEIEKKNQIESNQKIKLLIFNKKIEYLKIKLKIY